jgi:hypothetical protein
MRSRLCAGRVWWREKGGRQIPLSQRSTIHSIRSALTLCHTEQFVQIMLTVLLDTDILLLLFHHSRSTSIL